MIEEIERRLADGVESGRFEGLLFHGSGEPWEGKPRPGGDGMFWTASSAVIAQQYIPASGSTSIVTKVQSWRTDDRVLPELHSFWVTAAMQMTGLECSDAEYDPYGQLVSWRYPEGWPTYGQCQAWLENELGYVWRRDHEPVEVKVLMSDGAETLMPSDWSKDGTLLVTLSDGLAFRDLRRGGEGDLMDLEYHDYEAFEAAEAAGVDGVVINDFAQSDEGNLGHVSYGLTSHALSKLEWVAIPAKRHVYDWKQKDDITADIVEWASARLEPAAAASAMVTART